jgi:RNA polymerase sigma-70 factor, ECF subfamily
LRESLADVDLVSKATAGDRHAFSVLCGRYRHRIWRIAASVARGADAEDLAQEAVVRAYCALGGYRGEAPFEAWLCRIALNAAHDYVRSAWRRRVTLFDQLPDEGAPAPDSPQGEVERRELQQRVREAVAGLPENQRVPIWLHFFEGFTLAEVARLERIPEATARSRVRAGLRRLSLALDDLLAGAGEQSAALVPQQKGCSA